MIPVQIPCQLTTPVQIPCRPAGPLSRHHADHLCPNTMLTWYQHCTVLCSSSKAPIQLSSQPVAGTECLTTCTVLPALWAPQGSHYYLEGGLISTSTRPHQLHWGDRECGYRWLALDLHSHSAWQPTTMAACTRTHVQIHCLMIIVIRSE